MANTLKEGEERLAGEVTEVAPGAQFRVKLDNGKEILAHSAGKLKRKKIKIILSDRVIVSMSPQYNTERGIIVEREGFRRGLFFRNKKQRGPNTNKKKK